MFNYKIWGLEASIIAFIAVTTLVYYGNTDFFDTYYGEAIQSLRMPGLDTVMEAITYVGNWQSITIISILLLAFEKTRKVYGIPVAIAAILSSGINKIIKVTMARPRPDVENMLINQEGFSYTSGHTASAIAVFGVLAYLICKNFDNKKKAAMYASILSILAILISLSRIYLGVHYPSDVFGGFFVGTSILCLVGIIFYPYKKENEKWKKKFRDKIDNLDEIDAEVVDLEDND